MSAVIAIKDVLAALDALRISLANRAATIIEFGCSQYWEVDPDEHGIDQPHPRQLMVRDIEDDTKFIRELRLAQTSPELFSSKLASVLRALGTKQLPVSDGTELNPSKRPYSMRRGSDLVRDGMFLELYEEPAVPADCLAEVFYSDQTNEMVFTAFKEDVPLDAVEWLIANAKRLLPPVPKAPDDDPLTS